MFLEYGRCRPTSDNSWFTQACPYCKQLFKISHQKGVGDFNYVFSTAMMYFFHPTEGNMFTSN